MDVAGLQIFDETRRLQGFREEVFLPLRWIFFEIFSRKLDAESRATLPGIDSIFLGDGANVERHEAATRETGSSPKRVE